MSIDSFFKTAGAPSAKFPTPGTKVGGRILEIQPERQAREYKRADQAHLPDVPKTFPNGDPVMELPIIVQLAQFTPANDRDTGRRGFYIQKSSGLYKALVEGIRRTGVQPEVGGYLEIEFIESVQGKGPVPKKLYAVTRLEAPGASTGSFLSVADDPEEDEAPVTVPAQAAPAKVPASRPRARAAATPPSGDGAI